MTIVNGPCDLTSPADIGNTLLAICRSIALVDRFTPGAASEWGIEVDGKRFVVTTRQIEADEQLAQEPKTI